MASVGAPVAGEDNLVVGEPMSHQPVAVLRQEVESWETSRNRNEAKVRWRFTTEDARIKLEKLYPVLEYPDPH